MSKQKANILAASMLTIALAACGGGSGGTTDPVVEPTPTPTPTPTPDVTLSSIALESSISTIEALQSDSPFSLTGTYSDETTATLTADITWSSSDEAVLTVDSAGQVSGVAAGTATVTATVGEQTATADFTVSKAVTSVSIASDASNYFAQGATAQLTATVEFSDSTTSASEAITWSSGNTTVATIDSSGVLTPLAEGSVTITATFGSQSKTFDIAVAAQGFSRIESVQSYSILPSKIVSIFKVFDGEDKPVSGLAVSGTNTWKTNFKVEQSEETELVKSALGEESFAEIKPSTGLKLIQPTVLVVDISSSISNSELQATLDSIRDHYLTEDTENPGTYQLNSTNFVDGQSLAMVIFDGNVTDWFESTSDPVIISQKIQDLKDMNRQGSRQDPLSTALYDATVQGLNKWTDEFSTFGVTEGSLILITDGVDEGSVSQTETTVIQARGDKNLVTVFVDESAGTSVPAKLSVLASETKYSKKLNNFSDVGTVIKELGDDINAELNAIYVLEYVSPRRSGNHEFRVTYTDGQSDLPYIEGLYSANSFNTTPSEISITSPGAEVYGTTTKGYLNVKPQAVTTLKATTLWGTEIPAYEWLLTLDTLSPFTLSANSTSLSNITADLTGNDTLTIIDSANTRYNVNDPSNPLNTEYELTVATTETLVSTPKRQLRSNERVDISATSTAANPVFNWAVTSHNGATCYIYANENDFTNSTNESNTSEIQISASGSSTDAHCLLTTTDTANGNSKNNTYFAVGNVGTPLSVTVYDPDAETMYDFENNVLPTEFTGDWTIVNDTDYLSTGDYQLRSKSGLSQDEVSTVTLTLSSSAKSISFNYKEYRDTLDKAVFKVNGTKIINFDIDKTFYNYESESSSFDYFSHIFTEDEKAAGTITLEWEFTKNSFTTLSDYRFVIDNIHILNDVE